MPRLPRIPVNRTFYLELAAAGLRMPIGTDLVLHEKPHPGEIIHDGVKLGRVVQESACRYHTPLAVPLMDLMIEKTILLERLDVPQERIGTYHFEKPLDDKSVDRLLARIRDPLSGRWKATVDAVRYIAESTSLVPIGMSIGPFSLMSKLIADPITPVFLAGSGCRAEDDSEIFLMEQTLKLSLEMVLQSLRAQAAAGAKAVILCEPAANQVYISPKQLEAGSDVFERYIMHPNRTIKSLLNSLDCDLVFHDCGELTAEMVRSFGTLDPAILSLGSSRHLWEDANLVSKETVLFGNLPTKKFYSDDVISKAAVEEKTRELLERMKATRHPFILGSECDVLSVPGCERTIKDKVDAFMKA